MKKLIRERITSDRGSLPMAMLVVIVGASLAAMLVPLIVTQSATTRFDARRASTLQAAESGLDMTLGLIRTAGTYSAESGLLLGDPRRLPCGPLNGRVAAASPASYSVAIGYYTAMPVGRDPAWLSKEKMACTSGYGVYYNDGSAFGIRVPSYVLVTSTGRDEATGATRTLQATYTVSTTNVTVDGGALPLFARTDIPNPTTFCLDAGSAPPKVGTPVIIKPCVDPTPDSQKWSYRSNLTIRLTSTIGDKTLNPNGAGLCVASSGGSTVSLQLCPADTLDSNGKPVLGAYTLTWGIDDSGHFRLSNSTKDNLGSSCLNAGSLQSGDAVTLASCVGGTTDPNQAFNPRPTVGSGQAGPDAPNPNFLSDKQVVNFLQFSRCIDVTNNKTVVGDAGSPGGGAYLILYPCKQNPNPSALAANQKLTQVNVTGGVQWKTMGNYCLTSPLSAYNAKSNRAYVNVETCKSGTQSQIWTRFEGSTGEGTSEVALPTKQRYTLVDKNGLCLSPSPNEDMYNGNSKTVVLPCDGSLGQKWNVPPIEQRTALSNLHETIPTEAPGGN